jgi:hypothetical protein
MVEAKEALEDSKLADTGIKGSKTSLEAEALASRQWKNFGAGKEGEWAFATGRDGRLVKELEPAKGVIENLKKGQQLVIGDYRYKISADGKFLNRFSVTRNRAESAAFLREALANSFDVTR